MQTGDYNPGIRIRHIISVSFPFENAINLKCQIRNLTIMLKLKEYWNYGVILQLNKHWQIF